MKITIIEMRKADYSEKEVMSIKQRLQKRIKGENKTIIVDGIIKNLNFFDLDEALQVEEMRMNEVGSGKYLKHREKFIKDIQELKERAKKMQKEQLSEKE